MTNCDMHYFNITRLIESCPYVDYSIKEQLADYLYDIGIDLNCFNMDDFIVNGISFIDKEDFHEEYYDYQVIAENDKGYWVLN